MNGGTVRVLLAEECPVVRVGIRNVLSGINDILLIGEATTPDEILQQIYNTPSLLVLLDPCIFGNSLVDYIALIQQHCPAGKIVFFTSNYTNYMLTALMTGNARGCIVKTEPIDRILEALRTIAQGNTWVSQTVVEQLMYFANNGHDKLTNTYLTPREQEVLILIVEGKTNREIAVMLGISEHTAAKHVLEICGRLNVRSRTEAAVYALRNGLVQ
ncbi:MAG: hypothetical protein GFH27_549331n7 [Chloroflexi bacterium AL-W]|nr:hypothetical protein [Chloroflexi bacterium AL-W]